MSCQPIEYKWFAEFLVSHVPMPWAQGVVSSNLAAPTKPFVFSVSVIDECGSARLLFRQVRGVSYHCKSSKTDPNETPTSPAGGIA